MLRLSTVATLCACSVLIACGSDTGSLFGPRDSNGGSPNSDGGVGAFEAGGSSAQSGGSSVGGNDEGGGSGDGGAGAAGGPLDASFGGVPPLDAGVGGSPLDASLGGAPPLDAGTGGTQNDGSLGGEPGDSSVGTGGAGGSGGDDAGGSAGDGSGGIAGGGGIAGSGGVATGGTAGSGGAGDCIDNVACQSSLGSGHVCVGGDCIPGDCVTDSACAPGQICGLAQPYHCQACAADVECRADVNYGPSTVCVAGACVDGDCHINQDCNGKVCTNNVCTACTTTPGCVSAFGPGYLCAEGTCVKGNCTSDGNCSPGQICGLTTPNVCAACATDGQCATDLTYGTSTICVNGACTAGNCHGDLDCTPAGHQCVQNACAPCQSTAKCHQDPGYGLGYVCASGACVTGDCVASFDCTVGQVCGASTKNTCGACITDEQCKDDSHYGVGYLCSGGSCVLGNCHTDDDCDTGQICGVLEPNHCGTCSSDIQCQNDADAYGSGFVCSSDGACVSATCVTNHAACPQNSADFCCAGACALGDCCNSTDCAGNGGNYACVNGACTECLAPTGDAYYVNTVNGSDGIGTGSDAPGCAFKTIGAALRSIGVGGSTALKHVYVVPAGPVGVASGETFPIAVPANVIIEGSGGVATVLVPKSETGFTLRHPNSGLTALLIDGQSHVGGLGISVTTGASYLTTEISEVTVQNMSSDGIAVGGTGSVTIGGGVSSNGNGVHTNGITEASEGLQISGSGKAVIDVTSGDPVHFDGNAASGIYVLGSGSLTLTGTPGVGGAGTVTTNKNGHAGIWIEQSPAGVITSPPLNAVTGLAAWANAGDGIHVAGGSSLTLRGSYLLANSGSGVDVVTHVVGLTRSNVVAGIDLGTAGTNGNSGDNVLQATNENSPNLGAGICLALDRVAAKLTAAGNIFSGPVDCRSSTATLNSSTSCSNGVDYAIATKGIGIGNPQIVVTRCK